MDEIAARCSAHAPMAASGRFAAGTVFGDWRLTAFIGRGGNGEVYCAEHATLGTPAAVKVLMREDERARTRFAREARLLARLRSESFPRFFAYGEANGHPYLAMELLEPGDLPTGDRAIARFMLKTCDAVAELHAQGLVHRDIKPFNILWRTGKTGVSPVQVSAPVLADLGLVKKVATFDAGHPTSGITLGGVGTPGYGAPEQMERGEATVASDIHALGVLADRCFGGKPPRAWARIVQHATSSIPAHRYPSVMAFARAIRRRNLMRTTLSALAGACVLLLIGVAWIVLSPPAPLYAPSGEPIEHVNDCWEKIRDETFGFYRRAMALKAQIDGYDIKGAENGFDRKTFKTQVETERGELLRQWETAKKLQDEKIRAWKKKVVSSNEFVQNAAANSVATKLHDDMLAWREKVDSLLRNTLYFSCQQL